MKMSANQDHDFYSACLEVQIFTIKFLKGGKLKKRNLEQFFSAAKIILK
jgi:hypothetical protein